MRFRGSVYGYGTDNWGSWKDVLHSGNFSSYCATPTGTNATGTWGINISGTAANATTWNALSSDWSGAPVDPIYLIGFENTNHQAHLYVSDTIKSWLGLGSNAYSSTAYLPLAGGTLKTYSQYGQINDVLIINGYNTDGDPTLTTYYGSIKLSGNGYDWGAIRTIQSNPSRSWDNRLSFFTMNGNGGSLLERMSISNNGNVLIGTTTDYGSKLYVNGNIKTPAGTAIFSPIFYDSADTNYYLDPNSTSVLNTVTLTNKIEFVNLNSSISVGNGDGASYDTCNIDICGWYGIGIKGIS